MAINKISLHTKSNISFKNRNKSENSTRVRNPISPSRVLSNALMASAVISAGFLASCEKDDICPTNQDDKPTLVVDTTNVDSTQASGLDLDIPPPILEYDSLSNFLSEFDINAINPSSESINNAIDTIRAQKAQKAIIAGNEYNIMMINQDSTTYPVDENAPLLILGYSNNGGQINGTSNDDIIIANGFESILSYEGDDQVIATKISNIIDLGEGDDNLIGSELGKSSQEKIFIDLGHDDNTAYINNSDISDIIGGNDKDNVEIENSTVDNIELFDNNDSLIAKNGNTLGKIDMGLDSDFADIANYTKLLLGGGDDIATAVNGEEVQGGPGVDKMKINGAKLVMGNEGDDEIEAENISGHTHLGEGNDYFSGKNTGAVYADPGNDYMIVENVDGDVYPHYGNNVVYTNNVSGTLHLLDGQNIAYTQNTKNIRGKGGNNILYADSTATNMWLEGNNNIVNGIPQTPTTEVYSQERQDNFFETIQEQYGDGILNQAKNNLNNGWSISKMIWFFQRIIHPIIGTPHTVDVDDASSKPCEDQTNG